MKQKNANKELIQACLVNDTAKIDVLRAMEFRKIFKRKENGKDFTGKWAIFRA